MSQPDGPRGIEQLLRDTLVDPRRRLHPPPGHYESVGGRIGRARRRRSARWLAAAVGVVAVLAAGGLLANRTGTGPGPSALFSRSAPPSTAEPRYADWRPLSPSTSRPRTAGSTFWSSRPARCCGWTRGTSRSARRPRYSA